MNPVDQKYVCIKNLGPARTVFSLWEKTFDPFNREARKRELMKITRENQMILKRLQDKSASYNVSKWQKEKFQKNGPRWIAAP